MQYLYNFKNLIRAYPYYTGLILIVGIVAVGFVLFGNQSGDEDATKETVRKVELIPVSEYSSGALGVAVPTASGDSFVVRSEASGRVKRVVESGVEVKQGTVLAELENASELASLTQAQGAYEAAKASAEQSSFGVEERGETLESAYAEAKVDIRTAFTDVQDVMQNTIETFFNGTNQAAFDLNEQSWEKRLINYDLEDWKEVTVGALSDNQTMAALSQGANITERVSALVDVIYEHVIDEERGASPDYLDELATHKSNLSTARATLTSALWTLRDAKISVENAEAALSREEASSLGGSVSAEEARIKQALGNYQSAKASYDKTFVKAPFAGKIISKNIAVGDIINIGADVSIIVPAEGVETARYFELPLSAVKYTPDSAYVFTVEADNSLRAIEVETGLVTTSNIRVTGLNGDETIVRDVRGLKVGELVEVGNS